MATAVPQKKESAWSKYNPFNGRNVFKAMGAISTATAGPLKWIWNKNKGAKPATGLGGFLSNLWKFPFRLVASAAVLAVSTVASAVVGTVGAVTGGIIGGTFQSAGGLVQIAGGLLSGDLELIGKGFKNVFIGLAKFAVGTVVAGTIAAAVASGVGAPAVTAVSAVSGALSSVPVVGPALGIAATQAGTFIVNSGATLASTVGLGVKGATAATTATLTSPAAGMAAIGVGATAGLKAVHKLGHMGYDAIKKARGSKSTTQNLSDSVTSDATSESALASDFSSAAGDLDQHNTAYLSSTPRAIQHTPSATTESRRLTAGSPLSGTALENLQKDLGAINAKDKVKQSGSKLEITESGKPQFVGRDPVQALVGCEDETLQGLSYKLSVPSGGKKQAEQLLKEASDKGIKISKVEIGGVEYPLTGEPGKGYQLGKPKEAAVEQNPPQVGGPRVGR